MEPVRNDRQADDVRRTEHRRRILRPLRHAAPRFVLDAPTDEAPAATPPHPAPQPVVHGAPANQSKPPKQTDSRTPASAESQGTPTPPADAPRRAATSAPAAHGTEQRDASPPPSLQDAAAPDERAIQRQQAVRRAAQKRAARTGRERQTTTLAETAEPTEIRTDEAHALEVQAVRRRKRSEDQNDPSAPGSGPAAAAFDAPQPDEQITVQRLVSPEVLSRVLLFAVAGQAGDEAVMLLGVRIGQAGTLRVEIRRTGPRRVRLRLTGDDAARQRVEGELDALRDALAARRLIVEEVAFDE